jgi:membrane protein DedA with SNARE-associated domain
MPKALGLLSQYGYAVVFLTVLAEQIGVPVPSQLLLLATGALAGSAGLNLAVVLALASVASLIGDTVWYWIGRAGGPRVLGAHGPRVLVVVKFVPGLSTIAPPLAGVVGIPFAQFVLYSALGGLVWAGAFVLVGWVFSSELELAVSYVERLGSWALVLLAAALVGYVVWKFVTRQLFLRKIRIARISPEELKAKLDGGQDVLIVDVRDRLDFEAEPTIITGALHMAIEELDNRHHEIPREREIVLYCT